MSKEFNVVWEIQVNADNPKEAAKEALKIMQDKESEALFFGVTPLSGDDIDEEFIDLLEERNGTLEQIDIINKIISEHGDFTCADAEASSSPLINSLGKNYDMAERFYQHRAEIVRYVDEHEVDTYYMNYTDMEDHIIDEIHNLAERWEADQIQTEKRISD